MSRQTGKNRGRNSGNAKGPGGGRRYVAGRHVISELLEHAPERIEKVFIADSSKFPGKGGDARKRDLVESLQQEKTPLQFMSFDDLSALINSTSHQGFVALVRERHFMDLSDLIEETEDREKSIVLLLDRIEDPQNLGAILRAAECFGVDGVIWSKNRGADITPIVSKASVGASELINVIRVSNVTDAARKLKAAGYWIAASILDENAQPLDQFDAPNKIALIMGSEGEGLGRLIVEVSDYLLYIPQYGSIQSLNVSQATSVLLYELRKQMGQSRNVGH